MPTLGSVCLDPVLRQGTRPLDQWRTPARGAPKVLAGEDVGMAAAGDVVIAVHGGAGRRPGTTAADEHAFRAGVRGALDAGFAVLEAEGSALAAVEAAVRVLEDDPIFNAGRGAVLNRDGAVELDASIMEGSARAAGAVGGVRRVRHPITLARMILEAGESVLLVGEAAGDVADERRLERPGHEWFVTPLQRARWKDWRERADGVAGAQLELGTVGAVARDARGHLAAGTSTGGLRGKPPGRIGDTALIGAGTWADERCAVSLTGDGEGIIRTAAAHEVAALVGHRAETLAGAVDDVLHARLAAAGIDAGMVGVDAAGRVVLGVNCGFMPRGVRRGAEPAVVTLDA
jgi:beta-aspartyl-peptidase (threonine type)